MKEFFELIGIVIASLVPIVGAIYWLISVYYSQAGKLAAQEQGRMDAALKSLNETVGTHSDKLQRHTENILIYDKDLKYSIQKIDELKTDVKAMERSTDTYTKGLERKLGQLESEIKWIRDDLGIMKNKK